MGSQGGYLGSRCAETTVTPTLPTIPAPWGQTRDLRGIPPVVDNKLRKRNYVPDLLNWTIEFHAMPSIYFH